eukprot:CAMPEP_0170817622 /NCGR_PEP_ID=MMETSP0733-20121128/40140_1 /TAXON_ID=186038 /ORGANISM="Fragilariopsis kerguelensis, Strain L26-C5" /LENGTH=275 /DNA_ID=CAMNT_0011177359 /DNA_START=150 /DNA_END=981 /DNA_ORIENTATION=+
MVALTPIAARDNAPGSGFIDDLDCSSIDCNSHTANDDTTTATATATATAISCENINTTNTNTNTKVSNGKEEDIDDDVNDKQQQQQSTSTSKTEKQTTPIKKEKDESDNVDDTVHHQTTSHQVADKLKIDDDDNKSSFSEHSWTESDLELDLNDLAQLLTPVAAIIRNTNGRVGALEDGGEGHNQHPPRPATTTTTEMNTMEKGINPSFRYSSSDKHNRRLRLLLLRKGEKEEQEERNRCHEYDRLEKERSRQAVMKEQIRRREWKERYNGNSGN